MEVLRLNLNECINTSMRHGSLFSGIGGFDLAAEWMGWENVFQVELDKYLQKLLCKNFPLTDKYENIKEFDGTKYKGTIDIISGGFPCQPFSHAGKRKGSKDDRYLWPEMLRVIEEVKPSVVVGENVVGLKSMDNGGTLDQILIDLENQGYQVESFIIPACSVGAWHRRERIWIVAHSNSEGSQRRERNGMEFKEQQTTFRKRNTSYRRDRQWEFEPSVGRVVNGISNRVDRIKGLGNAIVPQVAHEIFKVIENQ